MSTDQMAMDLVTHEPDAEAASVERSREDGASTTEGTNRRKSNQAECGRCGHQWTGLGAAHCSACCQRGVPGDRATFATDTLFSAHRREVGERGECRAPEQVVKRSGKHAGERVMEFRRGMWRGPEMSEEQIAEAWGDAS